MEKEDIWLAALVRDTEVRRSLMVDRGQAIKPLDVWSVISDFDQAQPCLEVEKHILPVWEKLSERAKAHIGLQLALEVGGFHLNGNVLPVLETRWVLEGRKIPSLIQKRVRAEMVRQGIVDLPYFYVIEGRTRFGKSRTHLHIHGYLIADDPVVATRFKVALEGALQDGQLTRGRRDRGVVVAPLYEMRNGIQGPGHWVSYITKNVHRYDKRIKGRRVFFSHALTRNASEFWSMIREEADW